MTSQEVEEIKRHFDRVAGGLQAGMALLQGDVAGLKEDVTGLKQQAGRLEVEVAGLKEDVTGLKQQWGRLEVEVAGLKEDVAGLHKQGGRLEAQVAGLSADMTTLRSELKQFRLTSAETGDYLMQQIAEFGQRSDADGKQLRSMMATAEGNVIHLAGRVDDLTLEVRSGFAGVRADIQILYKADDELRRRIEAQ